MGAAGPASKDKSRRLVSYKGGVPPPPEWLDEDAVLEYVRVVDIIEESGETVSPVDMATLAIYAQSYSDVMRLTAEIRDAGDTLVSAKGMAYKNPATSVLNARHQTMLKAAVALGFTPAARARITVPQGVDKANPFAALLGGPSDE